MPIIRPAMTYADLAHMPDDGKRYELLEGVLTVSPSPNRKHQWVVWNLVIFFTQVKAARYGEAYVAPFDVILDTHNVVQPDVLFIRTDRLSIVTENNVQGAPDLVVEVLSPATRDRDLTAKAHLYAQFGITEYWIVDPDAETLAVYQLTDTGYAGGDPLTGSATWTSPLFSTVPVSISKLFHS